MPSDPQPTAYRQAVTSPLDEFGNYALISGTGDATLDLDDRIRVTGIRIVGGTFTVNANDEIDTALFGGEVVLNPKGNLKGPTIAISTSIAYLIEIVSNGTVP